MIHVVLYYWFVVLLFIYIGGDGVVDVSFDKLDRSDDLGVSNCCCIFVLFDIGVGVLAVRCVCSCVVICCICLFVVGVCELPIDLVISGC